MRWHSERNANGMLSKDKTKAKDKSKDKDKKDTSSVFDFESVWLKYPRKLGKTEAEKHFRASIKNPTDLDRIFRALDNYLADIKEKGTEDRYIQHGSTWFNKWQEWVDYVPQGSKDKSLTMLEKAKAIAEKYEEERI